MHNDDYTTMEFVVHVLQKYFTKTPSEAQAIMLEVHTRGFGICGIFTFEVAESKVAKVTKYAREHGHPLKCSTEPCDSDS
jgi:ATP-dependent Clp protease adaptor protein ClpS